MQLENFLKLAVAGSIVTTGGSLLALFIKDFFLTKYFEDRREKKTLDKAYKRYKDPILLSAIELSSRIIEIHSSYPTVYLNSTALNSTPSLRKNTTDDEHYRKYKFISTLFRLCSFFGWLELYRQEITFINSSDDKANSKLEKCLLDIRSVFAEGGLNNADNWEEWTDFLIFREEQRGIGERIIVNNDGTKSIMGYAKFKELVQENVDSKKNDWMDSAINFILDLKHEQDFRKIRLFLLISHFRLLLETLDKKQSKEVIDKIDTYLNDNKNLINP